MPIDKAIALARTVDQVDLKNPARVVIDNTLGNDRADDPKWGYVLRPDMNKLRAALASVFADLPTGTTAAEAARKAVKSEGAKVVVLNGTPEAGVGASVAAALTADGYNVVSLGNADRGDYTQSRLIVYGDSKPSTREELARRFGVAPANVRWEPTFRYHGSDPHRRQGSGDGKGSAPDGSRRTADCHAGLRSFSIDLMHLTQFQHRPTRLPPGRCFCLAGMTSII